MFSSACYYSHIDPQRFGVVFVVNIPYQNKGGHTFISGKKGFLRGHFRTEHNLHFPTMPPVEDNITYQALEEQHASCIEETFVVTHILRVRNNA